LKAAETPRMVGCPPIRGARGYAPDPISEKKKETNKFQRKDFPLSSFSFSKTKDKYLIHNCEEKGYYIMS
jgi:hypothetical protein